MSKEAKQLDSLKNYVWYPHNAYRKQMRIMVDGTTIAVMYQSRNLAHHLVLIDVDKLTDKHPKTKDVTIRYRLKYDQLVIHVHETTDPYYLVDALNDALYNDEDPVAHDVAGFSLLIRKSSSPLKNSVYTDKAFPQLFSIEVYYMDNRPNKVPKHVDEYVESIIESTKILAGKTSINYNKYYKYSGTNSFDMLFDMVDVLKKNNIDVSLDVVSDMVNAIRCQIRPGFKRSNRTPYLSEIDFDDIDY